jgi:hypothetical protein
MLLGLPGRDDSDRLIVPLGIDDNEGYTCPGHADNTESVLVRVRIVLDDGSVVVEDLDGIFVSQMSTPV